MLKEQTGNVRCPRCGSETYRWGHDINLRHLQRYRCRNPKCRRQFVPGRPERQRKYPSVKCPKCGSSMSIFKHLSDGYRLRCNRHNYRSKKRCCHKINIPLPGKEFKIAKDPVECIEVNISTKFYWNKMSFSKDTVSLALYFATFRALPATEVVQIMQELFNVKISHDAITYWRHKAALCLHKNLGPLSVPKSKRKRLYVDETVFKQRGKKQWLWMAKDSKFDSLQSWYLSPRRSTEHARSTFNIAFENSDSLKDAHIVTDGLWSYPCALEDLKFDLSRHIRYLNYKQETNNNRLERHWSTLKVRARRFRGLKSPLGLWSFVTGEVYLHNYFSPNRRLEGFTPAEKAGKKLPYCRSKWKLFTHFL